MIRLSFKTNSSLFRNYKILDDESVDAMWHSLCGGGIPPLYMPRTSKCCLESVIKALLFYALKKLTLEKGKFLILEAYGDRESDCDYFLTALSPENNMTARCPCKLNNKIRKINSFLSLLLFSVNVNKEGSHA